MTVRLIHVQTEALVMILWMVLNVAVQEAILMLVVWAALMNVNQILALMVQPVKVDLINLFAIVYLGLEVWNVKQESTIVLQILV